MFRRVALWDSFLTELEASTYVLTKGGHSKQRPWPKEGVAYSPTLNLPEPRERLPLHPALRLGATRQGVFNKLPRILGAMRHHGVAEGRAMASGALHFIHDATPFQRPSMQMLHGYSGGLKVRALRKGSRISRHVPCMDGNMTAVVFLALLSTATGYASQTIRRRSHGEFLVRPRRRRSLVRGR